MTDLKNDNGMKSLSRIIQWTLGALGAGIALLGALGIGASQPNAPGVSIWPMPGLVLLEWAVLGLLGFVGFIAEASWKRVINLTVTWYVVGALIPMMVIGAFSIGLLVLMTLLAFLVAALLASTQAKENWLRIFKTLLIGAISNLALLVLFIILGRAHF
jgi:hypothetical protein